MIGVSRHKGRSVLTVLLITATTGCGESQRPGNRVDNHVQRCPSITGIVTLYDDSGKALSTVPIGPMGRYKPLQMPSGSYKVGIESDPPLGARGGPPVSKYMKDGESLAMLRTRKEVRPNPGEV